jgi:AraC-like DNA-binding protein
MLLSTKFFGEEEKKQAPGFSKSAFDKLQSIIYRDIAINGLFIRILGIYYMDIGPHWNVKKHMHTFFEFHYVVEDSALTRIGNIEQEIPAGYFYLMPPGTFHSHRQADGKGHTGFALRWEFEGAGLEGSVAGLSKEMLLLREALMNAHSRPVRDGTSIITRMQDLLQAAETESSPLELQMLFSRILMTLGRHYSEKPVTKGGQDEFLFMENNIVKSALRFLEENYMQDIRVEDVADSVHISYSQLAKLFKMHTGETVNRNLSRIRLSRAQKLLVCSDKSMAQIAQEVGIESEHYFCTLFRQSCGVSPGAYRNGKTPLLE